MAIGDQYPTGFSGILSAQRVEAKELTVAQQKTPRSGEAF
jgi:hypothetical protein